MKKTEFRLKATAAISEAFIKAYRDTISTQVSIKTKQNYAYIDTSGEPAFSVTVNNKGITYRIRSFAGNQVEADYYIYNEADNHEEILKGMKNDFYKMLKKGSKVYGIHEIELITITKK